MEVKNGFSSEKEAWEYFKNHVGQIAQELFDNVMENDFDKGEYIAIMVLDMNDPEDLNKWNMRSVAMARRSEDG